MGLILGKFFKKKTTLDVLEKLETEIKEIENHRRDTEQYQRKIVGRFIIISIIVYLMTAFIFYFYFFPVSLYERLFYIIPLILAPVIIISVKRILTWYYNRKINKKQSKLKELKEKKQKLLEKVMETETYKAAKLILDKFAPEQLRKSTAPVTSSEITPYKPIPSSMYSASASTTGVRQRAYPQSSQLLRPSYTAGSTPIQPRTPYQAPVRSSPTTSLTSVPGTPLPLPRGILPRDRSVLDKMVDYLVGDGPSNRYALICKECSSHNGMAVKEEFDYISFRCCYCFHLNPARKKKPVAPQLELDVSKTAIQGLSSSSDSDKVSSSDSDSDVEKPKRDPPKIITNVSELDTIQNLESDWEKTVVVDSEISTKKEISEIDMNPEEIQESVAPKPDGVHLVPPRADDDDNSDMSIDEVDVPVMDIQENLVEESGATVREVEKIEAPVGECDLKEGLKPVENLPQD